MFNGSAHPMCWLHWWSHINRGWSSSGVNSVAAGSYSQKPHVPGDPTPQARSNPGPMFDFPWPKYFATANDCMWWVLNHDDGQHCKTNITRGKRFHGIVQACSVAISQPFWKAVWIHACTTIQVPRHYESVKSDSVFQSDLCVLKHSPNHFNETPGGNKDVQV